MTTTPERDLVRPISAGIVTALVGVASSFVVVLAGLRAVGATEAQAASGLMTLCITMGFASIWLSVQHRIPVISAWSTPGAALLVATGTVAGGWRAAVGAFIVTGILIVLSGLIPQLARLIAKIPTNLAQALLAGVVLQLCLAPIGAISLNPLAIIPIIVVWLLTLRFANRWAAPLTFAAAAVVIGFDLITSGTHLDTTTMLPRLELTVPEFTPAALIGIALPLFIVTMASQNIAGAAVLKSFDYEAPWRSSMVVTGVGTAVGAPFGGHTINLAAITQALAAGPDAGEDRSRRWIAGVTSGIAAIVLGLGSGGLTTLVSAAPDGVIATVAGLALLPTLASALKNALGNSNDLIAPIITFVVAASGIAILGISAAFWALVVGVIVQALFKPALFKRP